MITDAHIWHKGLTEKILLEAQNFTGIPEIKKLLDSITPNLNEKELRVIAGEIHDVFPKEIKNKIPIYWYG